MGNSRTDRRKLPCSLIGMVSASIILLIALGRPVCGQAQLFDPTHRIVGESTVSYGAASADLDLDGDLDLVFGSVTSGSSCAVYFNRSGLFSETPDWIPDSPYPTVHDVAVGDLNGDGFPDLVCGSVIGAPVAAYFNRGGEFEAAYGWQSDDRPETWSVALADFDNDGFLDLACGNDTTWDPGLAAVMVFLGNGNGFETTPSWTSSIHSNTSSVAWADVDGDGDPDLVCGHKYAPDVVYLNSGSELDPVPAWSSSDAFTTQSLALGDLDGDDRLDLVCGTAQNESNIVYLNSDTLFGVEPAWVLASTVDAKGASLVDADGDDDLDLIVASYNSRNEIYWNPGGGLEGVQPDPIGDSVDETWSVLTPDLDGDGKPDLVFSNRQENTCHRNLSFPFVLDPFWQPEHLSATRYYCAAFGLVDGDIYPDLVVSASQAALGDNRNLLFINRVGYFDNTPSWRTPESENTGCIALSDIDGDRKIDLVCGNLGVFNTMYLNTGSGFADTLAWRSSEEKQTNAVACGDIDGNGWNDLVCGNLSDYNEIYLNIDGVLQQEPAWLSAEPWSTTCLALVDLDGDRDLDLVCGNEAGAANEIYLNHGGTFGSSPDTTIAGSSETLCLATGDIDGDGNVDVVFGNLGDANQVFLGLGDGNFVSSSGGLMETEETFGIALVDVDADGDQDLVCADYGKPIVVHRNNGGQFSDDDLIRTVDTFSPNGLLAGDMDLDGDADLVIPGNNVRSVLLRGRHGSGHLGPPDSTGVWRGNRSPVLKEVTVAVWAESEQDNRYRVDLKAVDPDSDSVWIVPEYQLAGDPDWIRPDLWIAKALGPLEATPGGNEHTLEWNVREAPIDSRDVIVRLRTIPYPMSDTRVDLIPTHLVNAGPLAVFRPEISVAASRLDFATVTVGDTVQVPIRIENTGTDVLHVSELSNLSQMRVVPETPYWIEGGGAVDVTIYLEPTEDQIANFVCEIASNDDLTGTVSLPVTANVLELTDGIITQLLSPTEEAPLGDALTVLCTPGDDVAVDGGHLVYRAAGSGAFADSVALQKQTSDVAGEYYFYATIPGDHVTENNLEYYFGLHNSAVYRTEPAGAPGEFIPQAVAVPETLSSYATHTSGSDYLQGRSIPVTADLDVGVVYDSGRLFYRRGGEAEYDTLVLDPEGEGGPSAAIPESAVGVSGVEYYLEVETARTVLYDPTTDPSLHPHVLPVTVTGLVEPRVIPARTYRMVSIPLTYNESVNTMIEVLGTQGDAGFGDYDRAVWRCFRYDPATKRYLEATADDPQVRPSPGKGFWLVSAEQGSMTTGATPEGLSPDTSAPWEIELAAEAWNQVGNPFAFPVAWSDVTMDGESIAAAVVDSVIEVAVWDPATSEYTRTAPKFLEPFRGYFIMNRTDEDLVLAVPPVAADPDSVGAPQRTLRPVVAAGAWSITLTAHCGNHSDTGVIAGVHPEADEDLDRLDRAKPPASPVPGLRVYFPSNERNRNLGAFASDLRPLTAGAAARPEERGWTWHLDVRKDFDVDGVQDEVRLDPVGIEAVPAEFRVLLIDRIAKQTVDLRESGGYVYRQQRRETVTGVEDARFQLLVGTAEYVTSSREFGDLPSRTALGRNRPNPFNPATLVRYDLDRPARVRLSVYDVRGHLVRILVDEAMPVGRHEALWDGADRSGSPVASGVYFSRLQTDAGFQATRKMSLVR